MLFRTNNRGVVICIKYYRRILVLIKRWRDGRALRRVSMNLLATLGEIDVSVVELGVRGQRGSVSVLPEVK
jgi:hypothetical protein